MGLPAANAGEGQEAEFVAERASHNVVTWSWCLCHGGKVRGLGGGGSKVEGMGQKRF